ncbi:unnamed protein product [Schistocephalus solidus]|uniref:NADP-dependent 3-hydroxy acid dehydrogenase YdfG n=1 Tax=Schistocephalus solidus TaxID=70667 RepID=A0A183T0Q0_SCHSO|nr:unnamed protein product [Schistocephalus solidus]
MCLAGKVCLVVGASSGIGREIALKLGKEGATVICASRRKHLLESLAETIGKNGHPTCMDVEASISRLLGEFGRIDVLVYCAEIFTYSLVKNKFFECWKDMIATNCQANVVSIILSDMLEKDLAGHIIVVSSDAGRAPFPGLSVYSGTKFFTEGFLRSLRLEYKESKIRITSIQPGDVATPGQQWTTDTMASHQKYFFIFIQVLS